MFIDEDDAVGDAEAYDCDACPVADALGALEQDRENADAWFLFRRCVSRFTVDTHLAGVVLARMTGDLSVDEFSDLTDRFALLYETLYPADPKSDT